MIGHPTLLAYGALLLWFPISLFVFASLRPALALTVVVLGAVLLLPERLAFTFHGLPDLDKTAIASLSALAGCWLFAPAKLRARLPGRGVDLLVLVLVLGAFATAMTNGDTIAYGPTFLPGMRPWDALSLSAREILTLGIPFYLGCAVFRTPRDLRTLLVAAVVGALLYSLPMLYEIRMSPTLNWHIYGYQQAAFLMTYRWGGWRPMVFMAHPLALALFTATAAIAAAGLWRARIRLPRVPTGLAAAYLGVMLLLCKSLASIVYGVLVIPLVLFTKPKTQLRVATVVAVLVVLYPTLRAADLFPTHAMLEAARDVGAGRAQSLEYRFKNEEALLEKARQRVWFGWGTWNRNRVYSERSGGDTSVTDGYWIIRLGTQGVLGFLAAFGLLLLPVVFAARALPRFRSPRDRLLLATLGCLVMVNAVDMIPNAFITSFTLLLCGGLTGVVEEARAGRRVRAPAGAARAAGPRELSAALRNA